MIDRLETLEACPTYVLRTALTGNLSRRQLHCQLSQQKSRRAIYIMRIVAKVFELLEK